MKYHATITNEDGTTVSKGGNERLTITLKEGNKVVATLVQDAHGIRHDITQRTTRQDIRKCHLCGSIEKDKYCTNESCYEFTRYE